MKAVYNEMLMPSLMFFLRGKKVISISGSGGKTTLMIALGDYFENRGEHTLITTTTHLSNQENYGKADLFVENDDNNKYRCPGEKEIVKKLSDYDRVLIEADGSRRLPLKYHTSRDPVIIKETDVVLSVIGLSALGSKIDRVLFGVENYRTDTNDKSELVTLDTIKSLINEKEGVLKGTDGHSNFIVLNQADLLTPEGVEEVNTLMFKLQKNYLLISLSEKKLYAGVVF